MTKDLTKTIKEQKTTTKCNRCNSEVSFNKDDISSDDYYCVCLECDEDLFKIETYETEDRQND